MTQIPEPEDGGQQGEYDGHLKQDETFELHESKSLDQELPHTEDKPEPSETSLGEFAKVIKDVLVPNGGLCFVSCSTGKDKDSVAMTAGKEVGADVAAPTTDTSIRSFGAQIKGNAVHFKPQYYEGSTRKEAT